MLKAISTVVLLGSISIQAFANNQLSEFHKRFKFIKNNDGQVTQVKMKLVSEKLEVKTYISYVMKLVSDEMNTLRSKSAQSELDEFLNEIEASSNKSVESEESIAALRGSFKALKGSRVERYINDAKKSGIFEKFENELTNALSLLDLTMLANLEDSRYFYKRNVSYEVLTRVLNYAKNKLSNIPVLNLVSYVLIQTHDLMLEQRLYHQNMFLQYLQSVPESELGLTMDEADRIYSSIYESRISALAYNQSNEAAANWERYGTNIFFTNLRAANTKLRRARYDFDDVGARLSYAFFDATENGEKVIKNLMNNKHSFSSAMSTAFYYDEPSKVARFRTYLTLGKLGLKFLSLPGWLFDQAESFIDSYYKEQKLIEGALIAHFDITGNKRMSKQIKGQSLNPFIK